LGKDDKGGGQRSQDVIVEQAAAVARAPVDTVRATPREGKEMEGRKGAPA
jgi:hypothetical protein